MLKDHQTPTAQLPLKKLRQGKKERKDSLLRPNLGPLVMRPSCGQNQPSTGCLLCETFRRTFLQNPKASTEIWGTFGSPDPSFEDRLVFLPQKRVHEKEVFFSLPPEIHANDCKVPTPLLPWSRLELTTESCQPDQPGLLMFIAGEHLSFCWFGCSQRSHMCRTHEANLQL